MEKGAARQPRGGRKAIKGCNNNHCISNWVGTPKTDSCINNYVSRGTWLTRPQPPQKYGESTTELRKNHGAGWAGSD